MCQHYYTLYNSKFQIFKSHFSTNTVTLDPSNSTIYSDTPETDSNELLLYLHVLSTLHKIFFFSYQFLETHIQIHTHNLHTGILDNKVIASSDAHTTLINHHFEKFTPKKIDKDFHQKKRKQKSSFITAAWFDFNIRGSNTSYMESIAFSPLVLLSSYSFSPSTSFPTFLPML